MDLFDVARSCFRRWYVFIPLVLLAALYSYSVYSSVKPVYYSNAVLGLAPPSTRVDHVAPGAELPRNGLLDIGGATLVANMASAGLRQPAIVDKVVADGGLANFVTYLSPSPGGGQLPLINVDVTDADRDGVTRTMELVIAQSDTVLTNLQTLARVPESQMVKTFVVSPPSGPAAGMPTRTRSTIAVFVATLGLSVIIAVLTDIVLLRRRQRLTERANNPPADDRPVTDPTPNGATHSGTVPRLEDPALDSR